MLDYSCDAYKEAKEMQLCGFRGWRKNLKTAESDYEYKMGNCYNPIKQSKSSYDIARKQLEREDL